MTSEQLRSTIKSHFWGPNGDCYTQIWLSFLNILLSSSL